MDWKLRKEIILWMKNWGLRKISLVIFFPKWFFKTSHRRKLLKKNMVIEKKRFQAKILDSWSWLSTLGCIPIFIFFIQNIIDSVNVYNNTNTINFFKKMLSNWTLYLKEYKTSATFNWLLQFDACWFYGKINFNLIFGILFIGLN
jgi:hypothetical protein